MDPAAIVGIIVAFGALLGMLFLEGSSLQTILIPAPLLLVFGSTIAVTVASTTIPDSLLALRALPRAFVGRIAKPASVIDQIVEYAGVARRDGVLALEREAEKADDPFIRIALNNIADGTDPEQMHALLEDEMTARTRPGAIAARFYTTMGGYAPTIGIVGTVVSLTHVLENLAEPEKLGPSIAVAFVATLWGVLSANFMWLPIGSRLARLNELEAERMALIIEGMMGIQEGLQPRVLAERLRALAGADATAPAARPAPEREATGG
jgi:chemotaxis protein MotA